MGHDYPGRTGALRLDDNPPRVTGTDGCIGRLAANAFAEELRRDGEIITRRVEWPYRNERDNRHAIRGFSLAEEMLSFLRYDVHSVTFDERAAVELP